jgi:diadenosine tetraphosphate (Ap4A) HIT family hydrolase
MGRAIATPHSDGDGILPHGLPRPQGQADNLQQVSQAASEMGRMTQQNAAMVEQATGAAHNLGLQSGDLNRLVAAFQLHDHWAARDGGAGDGLGVPMRRVA